MTPLVFAGCSRTSDLCPVLDATVAQAAFRDRFGKKGCRTAEPSSAEREGCCSEREGDHTEREGASEAGERHAGQVHGQLYHLSWSAYYPWILCVTLTLQIANIAVRRRAWRRLCRQLRAATRYWKWTVRSSSWLWRQCSGSEITRERRRRLPSRSETERRQRLRGCKRDNWQWLSECDADTNPHWICLQEAIQNLY